MVFQWFPMVANHWSNDGMVTIHRYGLIGVLFWVPFSISQHTKGNRLNSWLGRWLELVNTISFWEKSGDAPSLYPSDHHPSPNISFRHHSSHCKKGWVKMGWTNEFRLMSSEENNRLWQMWINHLTANTDDWIWKIHEFFGRNPATLQRKRWYHLSARFDKCKTAKPANPYIYRMCTNTDKSLRAYTDFIFETCYMHMLERFVIQIITLTGKDDWS